MAERPIPEALARLDLASIADVGARQAIRALVNLVEELAAENQALRAENQQLRDEVRRLKGGSGRPKPPPGKAGGSTDYSSEAERRPAPKGWQRRGGKGGGRGGRAGGGGGAPGGGAPARVVGG